MRVERMVGDRRRAGGHQLTALRHLKREIALLRELAGSSRLDFLAFLLANAEFEATKRISEIEEESGEAS